MVVLIGDNCSTNRRFANDVGISFIGRASRKFNLAVEIILNEQKYVTNKLHAVMKKLKYPETAKLRIYTHLNPKCANSTRWSSTVEMLRCLIELKEYIPQLEIDDVDVLMPTITEIRKIEGLVSKLSQLHGVTKALHLVELNLSDSRTLFDTVLEDYPQLNTNLFRNANIVYDKIFERTVCKALDDQHSLLVSEEFEVLEPFRVGSILNETSTSSFELSLVDRAFKKRKLSNLSRTKYMDLRFILPTSNICERLFFSCWLHYHDPTQWYIAFEF